MATSSSPFYHLLRLSTYTFGAPRIALPSICTAVLESQQCLRADERYDLGGKVWSFRCGLAAAENPLTRQARHVVLGAVYGRSMVLF
jgi:hypothetical protein